MKLKQVTFNEDEEPAAATFEMSVEEAAIIYAFFGGVAPKAVSDASGHVEWGNALYDVADCLSGAFFNRFWDNGAAEVAPKFHVEVSR
jgi:hypothetical protein